MKIRNIIITLIFLVVAMSNLDEICKEYDDLEMKSNLYLKKEDLPQEFGDNALRK